MADKQINDSKMKEASNNIFFRDSQNGFAEFTHGSLFSGIGGFDLAAQWMGWKNVFHCEWNSFGQKVLKYYWPEAISYEDITKTDFTIHRGKIDILTGGFPCQPYSTAGKRKGKEDERHLWPEMLRAIREIQPQYVVGENVSGLVNWNGGMVFEEVQADLEAEGYKVRPFILPACAVNAPHRRDRVWFVARRIQGSFADCSCSRCNRNKKPKERCKCESSGISLNEFNTFCNNRSFADSNKCTTKSSRKSRKAKSNWSKNNDEQSSWGQQTQQHNRCGDVLQSSTDSDSQRLKECNNAGESEKQRWINREFSRIENWQDFPTQSPICDGDDGISSRLDGITFPKWRNESIKAGGNAIVPQVAYQIFKAIIETEFKMGEEKNIIAE